MHDVDAASQVDTSKTRRADRSHLVDVRSLCYFQDVLTGSILLLTLADCFQARDDYWIRPWLAPIVAVVLLVISGRYRRITWSRLRDQWGRIGVYARGDGPIPWMAATLLVMAPSWLLYLSNDRFLNVIDTLPVIPTAESWLTEGNLELSEYLDRSCGLNILAADGSIPACVVSIEGRYYSAYPIGMVPFATAVTGLAQLAHADLKQQIVQLRLQKVAGSLVAAFSVGLWFLVALRLGNPTAACVATAILATASGMFSTVSMGLWQHGGVILWSTLVLLVEFLPPSRRTWRGCVVQGVACSLMITCRLTSISFLAAFFAWISWKDRRRALITLAIACLAYLPWAGVYLTIYGRPFGPSTSFLSGGLWTTDLIGPLAGLLVSPGRGLLVYQPWIVLAALGALPWVGSRWRAAGLGEGPSGWRWFCCAAIAFQIVLISAWGCWWGGWCWGSRLVIETVPLFALLCISPIAALWRSRWGKSLTIALALLGMLAGLPGIYAHANLWNEAATLPDDLWSWTHAPFLGPTR